MTPDIAAALLALIEADPAAFATACEQIMPDDPETLANDTITYLSSEGGTEEEDTEPADETETEVA